MTSPLSASTSPYSIDDKDLDDATLWALMDSAAASLSSKSRKPPSTPVSFQSPPLLKPTKASKISYHYTPRSDSKLLTDGEVLHETRDCNNRPIKIARCGDSETSETSPLAVVRSVQRTPVSTPVMTYSSPEFGRRGDGLVSYQEREKEEATRHCLDRRFPSVSLFKEYQKAAMAILEKSDYTMLSGRPYIKKSGWRKISFYFNLSYEIRDKSIEFDENRDVQRAEFIVRAHMQGGRFSDGWGSCERREKRFSKPNHDIPSTAETRAKNKACQDLLGIGEYQPSASLS